MSIVVSMFNEEELSEDITFCDIDDSLIQEVNDELTQVQMDQMELSLEEMYNEGYYITWDDLIEGESDEDYQGD